MQYGQSTAIGLVVTLMASVACAEAQEADIQGSTAYIEDFDNGDLATALGGQLKPYSNDIWTIEIADGELIFENLTNPKSLHRNTFNWVQYPGSSLIERADGANLSVTVRSFNTSQGGGGIVVGHESGAQYFLFCVDRSGRYFLFEKKSGKTKVAFAGSSEFIKNNEKNTLSATWLEKSVIFTVNGNEVLQAPYNWRQGTTLGLGAFGIGRFAFDDVNIERGPIFDRSPPHRRKN